jgi:hypothetical protein
MMASDRVVLLRTHEILLDRKLLEIRAAAFASVVITQRITFKQDDGIPLRITESRIPSIVPSMPAAKNLARHFCTDGTFLMVFNDG